MSPLLANIALTGLEECLNVSYKEVHRNRNGTEDVTYYSQGNYRVTRYTDDFVIFTKTKENIRRVKGLLEPHLHEQGLKLAENKTHITHTRGSIS